MTASRTYFSKFPTISYNDYVIRDISVRTKLTQYIVETGIGLLPYTVKDGERPDNIAEFYYGDPYFSWAIYIANSIIDPYEDWPKDQQTFNSYIEEQYGGDERARDVIVGYRVNWAEDISIINPQQYDALPPENKKYWEADFGFNKEIISYHRRQLDWSLDNNRLDSIYVVASNTDVQDLANNLVLGERLYQYGVGQDVAVKATVVGVEESVSSNVITLNSTASEISFSISNTTAIVSGTFNLIPFARVVGSNLSANTRISSIINSTAVSLNKAPTGSSTGSYEITNPASAKVKVKQVDFYETIVTVNAVSTSAVPNQFLYYNGTGDYQDSNNYVIGRTSGANLVVLSTYRVDTNNVTEALLSNSHLSTSELIYWKSVNAYDDEYEKNEAKKEIFVLDRNLIEQLNSTLETLVKNG